MKTIKDAYKELKGTLESLNNRSCDTYLFHHPVDGNYLTDDTDEEYCGYKYICTVEEFNNYKGDGVKTTLDAVIEFKGKLKRYINDTHTICINPDNDRWYFNHGLCPVVGLSVCTAIEFNALVDDLASNMGRCNISFKEHCVNEAVRVIDDKPVYTQTMYDAGELPSVGMEYLCEDGQLNRCIDNLHGKVIGLMLEHVPVNGVLPLSQTSIGDCKPLTPLIDGKAYSFEDSQYGGCLGYYNFANNRFINADINIQANTCTNIKPLTVEGE